MKNSRVIAAQIIQAVYHGRSLTDSLAQHGASVKEVRDRAFIQAICYGVCRLSARLTIILNMLLEKPLKAKDADVHALLLVGLYQLTEMRVPDHAAVAETVSAVHALKKNWAKGLVNAVLRGYLRRKEEINQQIQHHEEAVYAHPHWWIAMIKAAWPADWQAILLENNKHPPFSLRVNQQHLSRAHYIEQLQQAGYEATALAETESGVVLQEPIDAMLLPGFSNGDVFIQDGAAQLAATLLALAPQQRILDACAAPGGKLTHLLEREPQLSVVAVEKDASRMASVTENLQRLKMHAQCDCADVADTAAWWDGMLFDHILLDAPCSASGVIRRHPDIKLLRQKNDIIVLSQTQQHLLAKLWPLLKPGGTLLYVTCSILPSENTVVLESFLNTHPDAREKKINATWGLACAIGRQILPGMHQMDGFYFACLEKMR
ncbi:MAG TPA: 16S rRNA (cytosine(967)-C(5))-methyltransferase RsmB [Gammaproteobacteria bacterium]|jgi:16S rRNA (cytosine967-C5)-methyltransferase|nr:16S rRNA (cytosine(967)-C(5))-methyltransferase RsmB [Gammaproteobacteria bacterium]